MAAVADYNPSVALFSQTEEYMEVTYDFAVDGGAVGALDLCQMDADCVVTTAHMKVKTLCTSGGSATVSVGKSGDAAGLVAATAVASLTAGAVIAGSAGSLAYKAASGTILQLAIAVAALTAGKIVVGLRVCKF